jgi:hypothetical protein
MHKKKVPAIQQADNRFTPTLIPGIGFLDDLCRKSQNGLALSESDYDQLRKIAGHYVDRHAADKSLDMVDRVYRRALDRIPHGRATVSASMWFICIGEPRR